MTRARLIEAIKANDPTGQGVGRVRTAASNGRLQCAEPGKCLLAIAWKGWVRYFTWSRTDYGTPNYIEMPHEFADVIKWFDFMGTEKANRAVLEMLNDKG